MDVLIVGAGFAGLYALHKLRGIGLRCQVWEQGSAIGGTWFWNRYPGARCDVPSFDYSYSFSEGLEQSWRWSEQYAAQPEILRYLDHVADRFDLRTDVRLDTKVVAATWNESSTTWTVRTDTGESCQVAYLVMATGCLSVPAVPRIDGLESFGGRVLHTGAWPQQPVDFGGEHVAVFGTGSSGVQVIPQIAAQARRVTVFQRTASFSLPARNAPIDDETFRSTVSGYRERRRRARASFAGIPVDPPRLGALAVPEDSRSETYENCWASGGFALLTAYLDLTVDRMANATAADFVRTKIAEIVHDHDTAERLMPHGYPIGAKRVCLDTDYYETFNRDGVDLVDLRRTPLSHITSCAVVSTEREYPVDSIVLATGFDAVTGALMRMDITGCDGRDLRTEWARGPRTHLGIAMNGFPNLFVITGPQSPSVRANMVAAIEQHVDWIADCFDHLRRSNLARIEADADAQDEWVSHVAEVASTTFIAEADSWYVGANIAGKARAVLPYLGSLSAYGALLDEVAADGYRGFSQSPSS